ncbi:MAG: hypothetical protein ACI4XL_05540 [Bacillus sp. (in: firmicutes)]
MNREKMNQVIAETFSGLYAFYRDANLHELGDLYEPGQIIHEKGFVDASMRSGGIVTTHRFLILSNHMAPLVNFEHGTNWGLFVADRDSRFKVLDVYSIRGKTQITLLHLPADDWTLFAYMDFNTDDAIIQQARKEFKGSIMSPPVEELATKEWLERCNFPIGMTEDGEFVPIFDH